jgi:23S rRNA pseudouridine2457 synthase
MLILMSKIVLFNKPFNVLTQFRPDADRPDRQTLAHFIQDASLRVAGRLDMDSEGLLLLTDDGVLNSRITEPKEKQFKTYWAQVDGIATGAQLAALQNGVVLNDGLTLPAQAKSIPEPAVWPRTPPVRYRANLPTSWLEIQICEGRNRQVRRMTAAVGLPTLRLIRVKIGPYSLGDLQPGESQFSTV